MGGRVHYISLIRVLATLCVVLFHSYAIYFYNVGLEYHFPSIKLYKWFFLIEERIQMPIFAFISGLLFKTQISKYKTITSLVKVKTYRLLFPYIVFGVLFYFTYPVSFSKTIVPYNTIGHLWFILMLFWLFPIQYLLQKLDFRIQFGIAFFMYLMYVKMPHFLGLSPVCWLFVFFNLAFNWEHFAKKSIGRLKYIIAFVLSILVIIIYENYENTFLYNLIHRLVYFLCSYFLISIIISCSKKFTHDVKVINLLDRSSFGIYIFHYWIMLNILDHCNFVRTFAYSHIVIYPIFMFLFLVFTSWGITALLIKIKPFNKLI